MCNPFPSSGYLALLKALGFKTLLDLDHLEQQCTELGAMCVYVAVLMLFVRIGYGLPFPIVSNRYLKENEGKGREGKRREEKGREGKGREGKRREGK